MHTLMNIQTIKEREAGPLVRSLGTEEEARGRSLLLHVSSDRVQISSYLSLLDLEVAVIGGSARPRRGWRSRLAIARIGRLLDPPGSGERSLPPGGLAQSGPVELVCRRIWAVADLVVGG
ncbi:hypothetical protein NL676_029968 [Syzygium grande]|nr:hypothetical protein NL676_029968 [Syzygium grande]